jgi:hypothetical protein
MLEKVLRNQKHGHHLLIIFSKQEKNNHGKNIYMWRYLLYIFTMKINFLI